VSYPGARRSVAHSCKAMKRRRPLPMHALPAFDAAARHGSFRAAAEELHLTPSAISHQIRTLEDALGVKLFRRLSRGLVLSDAGRAYAETVREALDRLDDGADGLNGAGEGKRVCISMPDFVARLFALPQIARFRARHPDLEIEINTGFGLCNLEAGGVDAAIRIGRGYWAETASYLFSPLVATFVASPDIAARAGELSDAARLPVVCLKDQETLTRESLARGGLTAAPTGMLRVDSCAGLVQAAEEGLGVAVIYHPPARVFEATERLARLPSCPVPVPFSMYFVCRRVDAERAEVRALREWVLEPGFCLPQTKPAARRVRREPDARRMD